MFCREQAARLAPKLPEIRAVGAELLFIGNGKPEHAGWFVDEVGLGPLPVYTDPRRDSFQSAGMKKGLVKTLLSPQVWAAGIRALRGGFRQTSTKGDPLQLGGVVVLDRKGAAVWTHVEEFAGDLVETEDVLATLRGHVKSA
jgi:hypothetical protein